MKRLKPKVGCEIRDCAYNTNGFCHADSVTIGDHGTPMCDTFCLSAIQGGSERTIAHVGACKVEDCQYNHDLLCQRNCITVGRRDDDFYCLSCKLSELAM